MSWVIKRKNIIKYMIRSRGCSSWQLLYNYECLMRVLYMWESVPSSLLRGLTTLWMAQDSSRHLLDV